MIRHTLLCILGAVVVQGCSVIGRENNGALKIDELRPIPPVVKTLRLTIQRDDLRQALADGSDLNSIRIIPLYTSANPVAIKEYRLFDIRPESAFKLLGLENSDILVAAHSYVVQDPQQFALYVRLLLNQNEGHIEVRRSGVPTLLQYSFIPSLDPDKKRDSNTRVEITPASRQRLEPGQEL